MSVPRPFATVGREIMNILVESPAMKIPRIALIRVTV
jgi:hypothetical protein